MRAVLHAQAISLKAHFPNIQLVCGKIDAVTHPTRAQKFEGYNRFAFLPQCEDYPSLITGAKCNALKIYWCARKWPNVDILICGHMQFVAGPTKLQLDRR